MHRAEHSQHTIRIDEKDATGIVAVEPAGPFIRVFRRAANDITFHDYPFKPFVLITDPALIDRSPVVTTRQQLEGSGALRWLVQTSNWHDWCLLRDYLHQSARPEEWFGIPDACQQFLVARGAAFFRGLSFREVTVLCISIETAEHEQLPLRRGHQCQQSVKAIAVADTTGYED